MSEPTYFMENRDEAYRLEMKTDMDQIAVQARWAGLRPGMRVADIGCGPGKITALLHQMAGPESIAVGVDQSKERIDHARTNYKEENLTFECRDITQPLDELGGFDFVYIRFVLEYFRSRAAEVVENLARIVKPGGILCLVDLDHNCLNHHGMPARLQRAILAIMERLEQNSDFDSRMGIKLYSLLYDLNFQAVDVRMDVHHLIFGELDSVQDYDWTRKVEVAARNCGYGFDEYDNGYEGFFTEFKGAMANPRRFIYTPVICSRAVRPA